MPAHLQAHLFRPPNALKIVFTPQEAACSSWQAQRRDRFAEQCTDAARVPYERADVTAAQDLMVLSVECLVHFMDRCAR